MHKDQRLRADAQINTGITFSRIQGPVQVEEFDVDEKVERERDDRGDTSSIMTLTSSPHIPIKSSS